MQGMDNGEAGANRTPLSETSPKDDSLGLEPKEDDLRHDPIRPESE
jgi:hypothetical protein